MQTISIPCPKVASRLKQNMVYICVPCNNRKGNQTLTAFITNESRDLSTILSRLRALGKDY